MTKVVSEKDRELILESCNFEIGEVSYLDKDCATFLEKIKKGFNRKYKVFVWNFSGKLELERYAKRFQTMIQNNPVFRTIYMYQNFELPIKVVAQKSKLQFPVTDLRKFTVERQKLVLRSAAAAQSRRLYDPQVDYPIKISAYITSDSRMKIILSLYPVPGFPFATRGIRDTLFSDLAFDEKYSVVDQETISTINEAVVKKCKEYWEETLYPVESGLMVPGISTERGGASILSTVHFTLKDTVSFGVANYVQKNNIKFETLFTECWGEMFGSLNTQTQPVIAVKKHGENLQILPVKVDRKLPNKERWENIEKQIEDFRKYSGCSFDDLCNAASIKALESFYALFEYQFDDEENMLSYAEESIAPIINIRVAKSDNLFEITYSYDAENVLLTAVERLHEAFCAVLESTITGIRFEGDKWKDRLLNASDEAMRNEETNLFKRTFFDGGVKISKETELDIETIIDNARLISYVQEDAILESGIAKGYVGIIVSGAVEERYINSQNMVRTIALYQDGTLLNLESISSKKLSPFSYYAIEDVKVLWILTSDLKMFMNLYPDAWANVLDKTITNVNGMKKLWGLE